MSNRKEIHDRVLNATDKDQLADAYKEWADQYDHDLLQEMDYVAPDHASKLLLSFLKDKNADIMDIGCGTGIVGEKLYAQGFDNLSGLDYSRHMLDKAEKKQVYQDLFQADLLQPLDIKNDRYDAIISVGTFTCGHVGPEALGELVRITKPGGYVCLTIREQAWEEDNYRATMDNMVEAGAWTPRDERTTEYIRQEGTNCKICLYQVEPSVKNKPPR